MLCPVCDKPYSGLLCNHVVEKHLHLRPTFTNDRWADRKCWCGESGIFAGACFLRHLTKLVGYDIYMSDQKIRKAIREHYLECLMGVEK